MGALLVKLTQSSINRLVRLWPDFFLPSSSTSRNTVSDSLHMPEANSSASQSLGAAMSQVDTSIVSQTKPCSDCLPICALGCLNVFFSVDNRKKSKLSLALWSCPQTPTSVKPSKTVWCLSSWLGHTVSPNLLSPWTTGRSRSSTVYSCPQVAPSAVQNCAVNVFLV